MTPRSQSMQPWGIERLAALRRFETRIRRLGSGHLVERELRDFATLLDRADYLTRFYRASAPDTVPAELARVLTSLEAGLERLHDALDDRVPFETTAMAARGASTA